MKRQRHREGKCLAPNYTASKSQDFNSDNLIEKGCLTIQLSYCHLFLALCSLFKYDFVPLHTISNLIFANDFER